MSITQYDTLTAIPGTTTGNPTPSRMWQWLRNGTAISGATSNIYTAQFTDIGSFLSLRQTETNMRGTFSSVSESIGPVAAFDPITFDPASLFDAGEVGHWAGGYDPAGGRVFQLSNGTTATTAAAQPVGLALGIEQGTALGSERVTNGDFSAGTTGFSLGTGWSVPANKAVAIAASGQLSQDNVFPSAGRYLITFEVSDYTSGSLTVNAGTGTGYPITGIGNGVFTLRVTNGGATPHRLLFTPASLTAAIDNISVREIPGNHALQATALSRPTLSRVPRGGRRNLLTHTEDFANAVWTKDGSITVTPNATTAPDGSMTADLVNSIGFFQQVAQAFVATDTSVVVSVFVRAGSTDTTEWGLLNPGGTLINVSGVQKISGPGTASSQTSRARVSGLTSEWTRFQYNFTGLTVGTTYRVMTYVGLQSAGASVGNVHMWGAQAEPGTAATPYQRVVSARDVTEAGVPDVWHLNNDGNDSLPATLPAGTYTAAWVNVLGAVTITPDASVTTTLDTLRGQDQADALIINRTLTAGEQAALTAYWQKKYIPEAPEAFTNLDWSLLNVLNVTTLRITNLPVNGGAQITALEYRINGNSIISISNIIPGDYIISANMDDTIEIRALNSVGTSPWSDVKVVPDPWAAIIANIPSAQRRLVMPFASPTVEFYQERTGASATTPALHNDPVGTIRDITTGVYMTAPSDGARGQCKISGGMRWIAGDGVSTEYTTTTTVDMSGDSIVHVFIGLLGESSVAGARMFALPPTGGLGGWVFDRLGTETQRPRFQNTIRTTSGSASNFLGPHTLRGFGNLTAPASELFRNNVSISSSSASVSGTNYGTQPIGLFRQPAFGARYLGNIYGVLVIAGTLTSTQINDVDNQLQKDVGL
jgi:hypothetical protein